jgi:hypothetical protein
VRLVYHEQRNRSAGQRFKKIAIAKPFRCDVEDTAIAGRYCLLGCFLLALRLR